MQDPEHVSHHADHIDKEKLREEYLYKVKKMKEVIATAIMSIARVAHQLKEDPKVTPVNADSKLSVCGLRLEHMVATLYKKKPTFNIESVNTDYSSDLPPYFLGIKNAIYVDPSKSEQENENEIDRFYNMSNKIKEVDEESDFVNDEYIKHKQVTKALAQQTNNGQPLFIQLTDKKLSKNGAQSNQETSA